MSILEAFISGCLQGITEFFPISSSGHLVILHSLFGIDKPQINFDILLHSATLCSVVIFFRKDILDIFSSQRKLISRIFIALIPTAIISFLLRSKCEALFARPKFTGFMFLVTACFLVLPKIKKNLQSEHVETKSSKTPTFIQAFLIGISQGIAIIPGISRSGVTISSGIVSGVDTSVAIKFSFLLSIPTILGISVVRFFLDVSNLAELELIPSLVGFISALFFGIVALNILVKLILKGKVHFFAIYLVLIGLFTIFKF